MRTSAWIGGVALASLTMGSAFAGSIEITGYGTSAYGPWPTTNVPPASESPWGGYTGEITVYTSDGTSFTTYCVDVDHDLQSASYTIGQLTENGHGDAISASTSYAIGKIADAGVYGLEHGNNDENVAAQAAIWVLGYGGPTASQYATNFADTAQKNYYDYFTTHDFGGTTYAEALIPQGDWPGGGGSQELVVGSVPEPSTWAMMGLGFAGLGFAGYRKTKAKPAFA